MKLRSLFLASIAALAMASCSNEENEVVDNAGKTETGLMQIGFTFPEGTTSRADGNATGDEVVGTGNEVTVNSLTVVLDYGAKREVKTININDIAYTASNKGFTTTFEAAAGTNVKLYVFINVPATPAIDFSAGVLADLTAADPIDGTSFMMSNKGNIVTADITANTTTLANVIVERANAKLEEKTTTTTYSVSDSELAKGTPTMSITLTGFGYYNLTKESYILGKGVSANAGNSNYVYDVPYTAGAPTFTSFAAEAANRTTYCRENTFAATEPATYEKNNTCVIYKAAAKFGSATAAQTFYVWNKNVYLTYNLLKAAHGSVPAESGTQAEFAAKGVAKYVDGVCYYIVPIKHGTVTDIKILRNNWYKLAVTSITKLGYPTDNVPNPDPTMVNLTVTFAPWTIQINDIEL